MKTCHRSFGVLLVAALTLVLSACERPRPVTQQQGFRGTGMVAVSSHYAVQQALASHVLPVALPAAAATGTKAGQVFKNVQVLADTDVAEFTRLMTAMTNWVSPKEGCAYCHDTADLAADTKYTKVVSRRMLEMTRHINANAKAHVAETGVTCYTCHRGNPVPSRIWFKDPGPAGASLAGYRDGQNAPASSVGLTSMPYDPFSDLFASAQPIRVAAVTALPTGTGRSIKDTEKTYGLMIHASEALGVNCTFCHNTRSFGDWTDNPPQRATAWHGIQMVRDLNANYLEPLTAVFPATRRGPLGDGPKLNCATCHQGASKPLGGASMVADFPELK